MQIIDQDNKQEINVTQSAYDLVVIGDINADLILKGDVVPAFGQVEQLIDTADLVMGSSAVIFACGAARLGLRTAFIGTVGDDIFGKFMINSMNERGIDTSAVIVDLKIQTGLTVILAKGIDRAILTFPGSIPALIYEIINFDLVKKCRHLHLSSFFMLDKLRPDIAKLFKKVKDLGLSISLDTNYDPAEKWNDGLFDALKYVDVLLPNDTEAKAIAGTENIKDALGTLVDCCATVAVKMGKDGALAQHRDGSFIQQKVTPLEVVDTVGAGDSFDAGFIYGYLQQWDLKETLRLAVACGSLSTQKAGGTDGQPDITGALDFIKNKKL